MDTTSIITLCGVTVVCDEVTGPEGAGVLTSCCGAPVKGYDTTRCKACKQIVPTNLGAGPRTAIHAAVTMAGCPCPDECTDNTFWRIEEAVGDMELRERF